MAMSYCHMDPIWADSEYLKLMGICVGYCQGESANLCDNCSTAPIRRKGFVKLDYKHFLNSFITRFNEENYDIDERKKGKDHISSVFVDRLDPIINEYIDIFSTLYRTFLNTRAVELRTFGAAEEVDSVYIRFLERRKYLKYRINHFSWDEINFIYEHCPERIFGYDC